MDGQTPERLIDRYQPLFQTICEWNRSGRYAGEAKNNVLTYQAARSKVNRLLKDLEDVTEPILEAQIKKLDLPIRFFIDYMMHKSGYTWAEKWWNERLGLEKGQYVGNEDFFKLLNNTLQEEGERADQRLEIFFTCLGLGFAGQFERKPEELRREMQKLHSRLRDRTHPDPKKPLCQGAGTPDLAQLTTPPSQKLLIISLIFVGLVVAFICGYVKVFNDAYDTISGGVDIILEKGK